MAPKAKANAKAKPAPTAQKGKPNPSGAGSAIIQPPSLTAGPQIKTQNTQKLQFGDIYNRFKIFGLHALYAALALFAYGFITASLMTFFNPFSPTDAGNDPELKKKMKIFERLDLLFPDDLQYSPYGFNINRGLIDKNGPKQTDEAKTAIADAYTKDNEINKYVIPAFVKLLETGGPNGYHSTVSEFPYTQLGLELTGDMTKIDSKTTTQQMENPGFWSSTGIWATELMTTSLYFSYGRGRYYLKEFFKFLNLCMKKATPISGGGSDDAPDYTYIRNIVALISIVILAFLTIVLLIWPSISLFIGAIINTYTKQGGTINNEKSLPPGVSLVTRILCRVIILLFAAIIIIPIAMFNHVWQPLVVIGTILLYPISYSASELIKMFIEIVPTLIALFVFGMIIAAMYDLDKPVAIAVSVFMLITYWLIFKDKVNSLIGFIGKIKTGVLGFRYTENKQTGTK